MAGKSGKKSNNGKKSQKAQGKAPPPAPLEQVPPKPKAVKKKQPKVKKAIPNNILDTLLRKEGKPSTSDALLRSMASGVGSSKEVFMTITDYFDGGVAATPLWVWNFDQSQELFTSGTASTDPLIKLIEASVYALPKFNATNTAADSVLILTTVPSFMGTQNADGVAANPRTTVLTPTPNSKWVLVGHYKAKKLFSGGLQPQVSNAGNQVVFAGGELDPDTLEKRTTDFPVQYKIVVRVSVGLDPITRFKYSLDLNDTQSSLAFPVQIATTLQPVVMQITGMGDIA